MKQRFQVTGMTCSACSSHVEKAVCKVAGVQDVTVSLLQNSMQVSYDEQAVDAAAIIHAVEDAGYGADLDQVELGSAPARKKSGGMSEEIRAMKFRLTVSIAFLAVLMVVSMGHMVGIPLPAFLHGTQNALSFAFTQFLLTLPILIVNRNYYIGGFKSLVKGAPNMDTLIALGSSAALLYGIVAIYAIGYGLGHGDLVLVEQYRTNLYFESAGMIVTLITVGKFLETRSKGKTSEAITKLMDLAPQTATLLRDGQTVEAPVSEVRVGDTVLVKPGQSIPVDGRVLKGLSAVDASALTGESIPVEVQPGDAVSAATLNKSGHLTLEATRVGNDTSLAQIIRLVEDAASSKAPIAKLADRVSAVFVPVVLSIAVLSTVVWLLLGYSWGFALSIGISVLVISCPCALGLATPTAIMVGTGKGAEYGILFKSAESLETAHHIQTVVLDKTGTVTEGHPSVTDVAPVQGVTEAELIALAAAMEQASEHPLAEAVVNRARAEGVILPEVEEFQALPGRGLRCRLNGTDCVAGNPALMKELGIDLGDLAQRGAEWASTG